MKSGRFFKLRLSLFVLLWGWCCTVPAGAQKADSILADPEYLRQTNAWLSSGQVLGLQYIPFQRLSVATVGAVQKKGQFINFHESGNSLSARAGISSYRRLNPSVVFTGAISYENFLGKNMGGSVFLDPYQNPLDIVEYADTTTGSKRLEQYHIEGGVSVQATGKLRLGGKILYETANYTKLKDMRHTNKLLRLDLSLSAAYEIGPRLNIGLAYDYFRRIESVGFNIYGNTDRQYLSLISFGSFYGMIELYDTDNGYTADTNPMFSARHSASAIVNGEIGDGFSWFSQLTYGSGTGYFGKKGSSQILHTRHQSHQYAYRGILTLKAPGKLHHLDLGVSSGSVDNFQNIYRKETSLGGNTSIVYYGRNKVMDRTVTRGSLAYTLHSDIRNALPGWTFLLKGDYTDHRQTVSLYPYYRRQEISSWLVSLAGGRHIARQKNIYSLSLGSLYGTGGGTARDDGVYATPSSNQSVPISKDSYLLREFEYLTAARITNSVAAGYTRLLKKQESCHIKSNFSHTNAFNAQYTGRNFTSVSLTLGYTF